jgi:hypothetical protein
MRKIILLVLALAAALLLWDAHRWYDGRVARQSGFRSQATANELSGWQDGRQQWLLRAAVLTRTDAGVDAAGIGDGVLHRDGAAPLHFSAPRASYREKDGLLRFPAGVALALDGKSLQVADGLYDDKARSFRGSGVLLTAGPGRSPRWEVRAAGIAYSQSAHQWLLEKEVNIKWRTSSGGDPCTLATSLLILDDTFAAAVMPRPVSLAGGSFAGTAASASWADDTLTLHRVKLRDGDWSAALAASTATRRDDAWLFAGVTIRKDNGDVWLADRLEIGDGGAVALAGVTGKIGAGDFTAAGLLSDDRKHYRTDGAVVVRPRGDVTLAADRLTFAEREEKYRFDKPCLRQDNGTEITADAGLYDGERRLVTFTANVVTVRRDGREIRAAKAVYDLDRRVVEYAGAVSSVRRGSGEGGQR